MNVYVFEHRSGHITEYVVQVMEDGILTDQKFYPTILEALVSGLHIALQNKAKLCIIDYIQC